MSMDVLYDENDAREALNKRVQCQIDEIEKKCTPFPVSCHQRDGVWGIWLQSGDEFLLVNPIELVSSVFENDVYYLLQYYKKEFEGKEPQGYFYVDIRCENHAYHWRLSHSMLAFSGQRSFTIEEYLTKTKAAIDELYQVWSKNEPIAYEKYDATLEGVEICKKQMEIKAAMPSNHILMNALVQKEKFHFYPVEDEFFEDYFIGIGNREYKTCLTDWDNDLECIRHQLETYVYEREAKLKLSFDMSDTIVRFKKESVLDHINNDGEGCGYSYADYVLVEVIPNEFVHKPILKGYCDEKETIRTMYEGLLRHAMRFPLDASEHYDIPDRLIGYNKIKSLIIESFLKDEEHTLETYATRQVHVKHILTIEPDVKKLFHDEENVCDVDFDELYDKDGKPIEINGFKEWQKEIEPVVIAAQTGKAYEMDWADYHKRGLELARQLRAQLSTDFDLWYAAPWEDKSGTIKSIQLVL